MASPDGESQKMPKLRHQEIQRKETEGARDMNAIISFAVTREEAEELAHKTRIAFMLHHLPDRECKIEIERDKGP